MKQAFMTQKFQSKVLDIIEKANHVIADYATQGLTLTVRQLYYRFIAFNLFPDSWIDEKYNVKNGLDKSTKNTLKNYKRLAGILNDGRLCGHIDWDAIEDRTRWLRDYSEYDDPAHKLRGVPYEYAERIWHEQEHYCEVWVEKDALVGVIEGPCRALRVPYFPTRGFVSQSEAFSAGQRIGDIARTGKKIVIFHLGDHDPSGLDMSRDIEERLMMFGRQGNIDFRRLALNMDQVKQYDPPPNPAKETDSRFAGYEASYGDVSWELDALEPRVISELVRANVESLIDRPLFDKAVAEEEANRAQLHKLSANWAEVTTLLGMIEEDIS
jgi:hypothetical protein